MSVYKNNVQLLITISFYMTIVKTSEIFRSNFADQSYAPLWSIIKSKPNDTRIVGGTNASLADAPYQVAIWDLQYSPQFPFCGGVIISKFYVLTAAHCTERITPQARVDYNRVLTNASTVTAFGVSISRVIIHPEYNPDFSLDNDIALIKLSRALQLGPNKAKEVILPAHGSDPTAGTRVQVTGWGRTENGRQTSVLQKASVAVVDRNACRAAYGERVTDNMVCAGVDDGSMDACSGDSGGPMTSNGVLLGIVSWGRGCGEPGYPGVYMRVANYVNWIYDNVQKCLDFDIIRICLPTL